MFQYTRRLLAPVLFATLVVGACQRADEEGSLSEDSALSRDLARAGMDTTVQPQLTDVPPTTQPEEPVAQPTTTPRRQPTRRTTAPRPRQETPPAPAPTTTNTPTTTSSGNTVSTGTPGGERPLGAIPAGTQLTLSSTEKVCTGQNKVGDRFVATVTTTVTGENGAVIPAGSRVLLEVTKLKHSENTNDKIEMGFRVVSVTANGKTYSPDADIVSAEIDRIRGSTRGNDAKKVLGGAVVGAILGQVIGKDRKGTVVGAAAGAAAGAATAAATADYHGCVNVGAPITIKLNSSLTVAAD